MSTTELMNRTQALAVAGDIAYAARQDGLHRVDAGGAAQNLYKSWRPDHDLPTAAVAHDAASGLLLAGINGGVARSADGGANWEARPFRSPPPLVTCLALSPDFATDGCALAGTFEDGCFGSSDGGRTWRAQNHGLFDHSVFCLALSPRFSEDGRVYAGTSSGIYRSDNGGRLWRDLLMPAGDETVLSLALSVDGALYAGTEAHGLLRSADAGETWETLLAADGAINGLALARNGAIIAQVDDSVLTSFDAGASWNTIVAEGVDCLALAADEDALVLAMAEGGLRRETIS